MHDDRIDLQAIDIRTLPPEQWETVLRLATKRAHLERSRSCRDLMARVRRGTAAWARRILSPGGPAGYQS